MRVVRGRVLKLRPGTGDGRQGFRTGDRMPGLGTGDGMPGLGMPGLGMGGGAGETG